MNCVELAERGLAQAAASRSQDAAAGSEEKQPLVQAGSTVDLADLQLRIARRADELAREEAGHWHRGSGRRLWIKAERELLGPVSKSALFDLLKLCAATAARSVGR